MSGSRKQTSKCSRQSKLQCSKKLLRKSKPKNGSINTLHYEGYFFSFFSKQANIIRDFLENFRDMLKTILRFYAPHQVLLDMLRVSILKKATVTVKEGDYRLTDYMMEKS